MNSFRNRVVYDIDNKVSVRLVQLVVEMPSGANLYRAYRMDNDELVVTRMSWWQQIVWGL